MQQNDNNILIYQDDNGISTMNLQCSDEDMWLNQSRKKNKSLKISVTCHHVTVTC